LKLKHDEVLSNFAFNFFNLRRYTEVPYTNMYVETAVARTFPWLGGAARTFKTHVESAWFQAIETII
jgi:hypothetical protein